METGFEAYQEKRPPGLVVCFFETSGQFLGLALGGGMDFVRQKKELGEHRTLWMLPPHFFLALTWPFLDKSIIKLPFSTQFRLRLQRLGPTYIFYFLVTGDPESAARYLTSLTIPGKGADIEGFRRAASDLYARWLTPPNFRDFSLAQVILQSILMAGHYKIQYPGEIILMAKALVTIEGVGHIFDPEIDIPSAARRHVRSILMQEFNPVNLIRDSALVLPEMVDVLRKSPLILTEGMRVLESNLKKPPIGPLNGVRGTLLAGFCLLAGAVILAFNGPWYAWAGLFLIALFLAIRS